MSLLDRVINPLKSINPGLGPDSSAQEIKQTQDEMALAKWIRNKCEESRAAASRIAHEGIWMTNIAYVLGYSGLTYNTLMRQFVQNNDASIFLRQRRIQINKLLPTLQNRQAKLCKNPPKFDVLPESNTSDSKDIARLNLDILKALMIKTEAMNKRFPLTMWQQQCGHAYIGVYWDDTLGNFITDPMTGEAMFEGDIRLDVISPFEMFPDPHAKTFDDLQWIIRAKIRPLEYFRNQYPERGHLVKEEDIWLLSAQYEQRINAMNTRGPTQGNASIQKNCALELAYYEKKSKKYPNGRLCIMANNILLENKELPVGEIPFAKFDDFLVGGKYYSEALVTHLRPLQDYTNQIYKQRSDWTRRLLSGKMIAARGSELAQESLNDQSGEIVYYTPVTNAADGGKPSPLQMPTIPQYAYTEEDKIDEKFNEISGISEVSKGNLPSASIPAIGMQLLVEQDDTRIGVVTERNEHAWARVGSLMLKYAEKFYITPRKLKIAGKSGYIVKEIEGSAIQGHTDVTVIRGSTLPGSKVLQRQDVLNAYQQGLLGDPQDPSVREKVLSILEFGDVSEMWLDISLDQAQIKRGIEMLEKGEQPPVGELDNHKLWIEELNRYRKQEKFEELPEEIQRMFMECIEQHTQALLLLSGQIQDELSPEEQAKAQESADKAMSSQPMGQVDETINEGVPQ